MFQIDYAGKAIEQSGTLIGLRGKNGVVLAVEKIVRSSLYEEDAGCRIYSVDKHIGIVSIQFEAMFFCFNAHESQLDDFFLCTIQGPRWIAG